jgi:hypothetical protein
MSYVVSLIVFFTASLVGASVTAGAFHLLTHSAGPGALGALVFWPVWILIYFCAGAAILGFLT